MIIFVKNILFLRFHYSIFFKIQRYAKIRNTRLKSHQLGVTISYPDVENIQNEHESIVQDKKSSIEEDKKLINSANSLGLNVKSCSASLEDNLSEFANSRTMIKSQDFSELITVFFIVMVKCAIFQLGVKSPVNKSLLGKFLY